MIRPKRDIKPPSNLKEYVINSETEKESDKDAGTVDSPIKSDDLNDDDLLTDSKRPKKPIRLTCRYCTKKFQSYGLYFQHIKLHKGKNFLCEECGKLLSNHHSFTEHMNIHRDIKPHKCGICGQQSRHQSVHLRHMNSHVTENTHECSTCGKLFKQYEYLRQHMRKHEGVKPFKCPNCPKSFSSKTGLNRHLISHSNKKPHQCSHCHQHFKMKHNLIAHLKLHTSKIPPRHKRGISNISKHSTKDKVTPRGKAIFLKLIKKDSRTITVMPGKRPSHLISLPTHLNLNNPETLVNSDISLRVNDVIFPIAILAESFGTGDLIDLKIVDEFDTTSQTKQQNTGEDVHISLVDQTPKVQVIGPSKNEDKVDVAATPKIKNKVSEKNVQKEFLELASTIKTDSVTTENFQPMLGRLDDLKNLCHQLSFPLNPEVSAELHHIISKFQKALVESLPIEGRDKINEDSVKDAKKERSKAAEENRSAVSSEQFSLKWTKQLYRSYLFFLSILQKHFHKSLFDKSSVTIK